MEFNDYSQVIQPVIDKPIPTHRKYQCGYCDTSWLDKLPKSNCWSCDREVVLLTI